MVYNPNMTTVTVAKKEYEKLLETRLRYEHLKAVMQEDLFSPPPTTSRKSVLADFRSTKRCNRKFLNNLKRGLERSSYFH